MQNLSSEVPSDAMPTCPAVQRMLVAACVTGMTVPTLLHAFRLAPKIAAGPVTLALVDIFTLPSYFGVAWSLRWALGQRLAAVPGRRRPAAPKEYPAT